MTTIGGVEVDQAFTPYDTEIIKMQAVKDDIDQRARDRGGRIDRDAMDREIKHRMAEEAGIIVDVRWYTVGEEMPDGTLKEIPGRYDAYPVPLRRVEKGGFDHERQRHEVVNDVLGLGEGGLIKVTPSEVRAALEHHAKGHRHG
jgi:hypothetical protein